MEIQNYFMANDIFFEKTYKKNQVLEIVTTFQKSHVCDNVVI